MKRKIAIIATLFLLICGTAYAANGSLVKVLVNGKAVQSGQIINGSTMLPLKAVAEALGARVDWDNIKKQATITTAPAPVQPAQNGLSLAQLNKIGESVGLVYAYAGQQAIAQGSGFIVNTDVFVTNWHVAKGSDTLTINFADKQEVVKVADALFKNEDEDLIGFRVKGYPSLTLNTGTPVNKDKVYALGYPSSKFTITEGMFVSEWNDDRWSHYPDTMPGASGGALINSTGEVIGVTSTVGTAVRSSILRLELNKI
ncbi:hypothetical protein GXP70_18075 [Paenibacillus lycopersici]|uniref:Serine protease n=1 Tax=Paenibacillus lycopersici TaxID=2704462 RepID=A0A6C0G028_9BACL|nr:trypsin-like peptidase domain-containing protein [Paenibacillus lycopersici]QHT61692.1 hypothetical protein GXP70_18075 [Paenibacillus lycopersici]